MPGESFDRVYETYFDPVYRYALTLTGDSHAAEEITQETFFKAMRSLKQFRGECSLKSWLCAIAKNLWLSEKRKKTPQPLEAAQDTADPGLLPDDAAIARMDGLHIHKLVHELPEPQREVFMLRTLGQLSFRDIGELFGKTENWACVVYHRARTRLKTNMEESI